MEDFKVDLSKIAENRIPGVSGMMRVRNDAEFIEACVESCIDALDELVIVYNDCTDSSPIVIREMELRYPDKIKVFEYKPEIFAWNLSDDLIKGIFDGTIPSENTLAGYYNFALSKTTREFVMKIDADQIYDSLKLTTFCSLYRLNKYNASYIKNIHSHFYIIIFSIYYFFAKRIKLLQFVLSKSFCKNYYKSALYL